MSIMYVLCGFLYIVVGCCKLELLKVFLGFCEMLSNLIGVVGLLENSVKMIDVMDKDELVVLVCLIICCGLDWLVRVRLGIGWLFVLVLVLGIVVGLMLFYSIY